MGARRCEVRSRDLIGLGPVLSDLSGIGSSERSDEVGFAEVATVCGRAGLLPPGIGEGTGIEAVEAELVDEPQHESLVARLIACYREANAFGGPGRNTAAAKAGRDDVVERLHDSATEHARNPLAFRQSALDLCDVAIAGWVVVAGVNDDSRRGTECLAWQTAYPGFGNGEDYDVFDESNLLDGRWGDESFGGKAGQRRRAARVCDADPVLERREATGEQTADVAGPNDPDVHVPCS
ncbi:MAG TPA: hypothetical protein VER12_08770 [Polyangiaceae bacterium]|nr:hypothetical protein [Polyangiaceae bacterium]